MADKLRMDYINSLPQPFIARLAGGVEWPIYDIEVETALCRIDVVGRLQVIPFCEVMSITDYAGTRHDPEDFWVDSLQSTAPTTDEAAK